MIPVSNIPESIYRKCYGAYYKPPATTPEIMATREPSPLSDPAQKDYLFVYKSPRDCEPTEITVVTRHANTYTTIRTGGGLGGPPVVRHVVGTYGDSAFPWSAIMPMIRELQQRCGMPVRFSTSLASIPDINEQNWNQGTGDFNDPLQF